MDNDNRGEEGEDDDEFLTGEESTLKELALGSRVGLTGGNSSLKDCARGKELVLLAALLAPSLRALLLPPFNT